MPSCPISGLLRSRERRAGELMSGGRGFEGERGLNGLSGQTKATPTGASSSLRAEPGGDSLDEVR
eukprot:scaffold147951_cov31-Tisochrysis_lutea.AAC.1